MPRPPIRLRYIFGASAIVTLFSPIFFVVQGAMPAGYLFLNMLLAGALTSVGIAVFLFINNFRSRTELWYLVEMAVGVGLTTLVASMALFIFQLDDWWEELLVKDFSLAMQMLIVDKGLIPFLYGAVGGIIYHVFATTYR